MSTPARTSALRAVPASPIAGTRHRPLPIPSVRLVGGPLAAWQQRNGEGAVAAAVDATGTRFFYANPLQQRRDHHSEENAPRERAPWYVCACCPPNIARTVAQLSAYVATVTDGALWLHQLADAEIDLPAELGTGTVRMVTGYPADGRVEIRVEGDVVPGAELSVRIPGWSPRSTVVGPDGARERDGDGYARVLLEPGARYVLDLNLTPRLTTAHHRVDALRGAVAVERGPVVYCVEQADLDAPFDVDDLAVLPVPITVGERDTLVLRCRVINAADGLYGPDAATELGDEHTVTAIPFSTWGNRAPGPMRVWLPRAPR